ncbi:winged helix-turn-helix transcriptional regulator [Paenibacillus sp. CN-4]
MNELRRLLPDNDITQWMLTLHLRELEEKIVKRTIRPRL